MKKLIMAASAAVLGLTLAACEQEVETPTPTPTSEPTERPEPCNTADLGPDEVCP